MKILTTIDELRAYYPSLGEYVTVDDLRVLLTEEAKMGHPIPEFAVELKKAIYHGEYAPPQTVDDFPEAEEPEAPEQDEPEEPELPEISVTQLTLISYLLVNPDAWSVASSIMKPEYFDKQYAAVIDYAQEHLAEYKMLPTRDMVRMRTQVRLIQPETDPTDPRVTEWLLNETETFCRHQAMRREILAAAELIAKDKSRAAAESVLGRMKNVVEIGIHRDSGFEVHRDMRTALSQKLKVGKIASGYRHLDMALHGGLPSPGMIMFVGRSGKGKSVMLSNCSINAALHDRNVMYISLELDETRLLGRFAAQMTGIPSFQVVEKADEVCYQLEGREGEGRIFVKKMRMGSTVGDIYAYWKRLLSVEKCRCTVAVLDYIGRAAPMRRGVDINDLHMLAKYVGEEFYNFCTDNELQGLTASQMTKQQDVNETWHHGSIAGGTPLIEITDYSYGLQRTDNGLNLMPLKTRDGGDDIVIPLLWDRATTRVTDDTDEAFYERNPSLNPALAQKIMNKNAAQGGRMNSALKEHVNTTTTKRASASSLRNKGVESSRGSSAAAASGGADDDLIT